MLEGAFDLFDFMPCECMYTASVLSCTWIRINYGDMCSELGIHDDDNFAFLHCVKQIGFFFGLPM